jgi:hypothetical protein
MALAVACDVHVYTWCVVVCSHYVDRAATCTEDQRCERKLNEYMFWDILL